MGNNRIRQWHIHADLDTVTHVRFAEKPSMTTQSVFL